MGGNNGLFSSLFGGGGYEAPESVSYESLPARDSAGDPEERATREAEMRKNRARAGGVRATLLDNPLGGAAGSANPSGRLGTSGAQVRSQTA